MTQRVLIVGFSLISEYPKELLKELKLENVDIEVISVYSLIHENTIKKYIKKILGKNKSNWADFKELAGHLKNCGINEKKIINISPKKLSFWPKNIKELIALYKQTKLVVNGEVAQVDLFGVESSGYILDSLQRWVKGFRIEYGLTLINKYLIFYYLLKISRIARWISEQKDFKSLEAVIVNHSVYFESGWIATFISENYEIPIIHIQSIQTRIAYLDQRKRSIWFESSLNSIELVSEANAKALPWYDQESIAALPDLRKKEIDSSRVLVVMHAFSDANDIFWKPDLLYHTYYHWIKESLEIAKLNPTIQYTFRIHPSTFKYYNKDLLLINYLFHEKYNNIKIEEPQLNQVDHFKLSIPIVITCRGSIALELACSGIKSICTYLPHAPNGVYILPNSKQDYFNYLNGKVNIKNFYLTDEQVHSARIYKTKLNMLVK